MKTPADEQAWKLLDLIEGLIEAKKAVKADRDDYEQRWLAECRAHGETRRKLEAAEHELTCNEGDDCRHEPAPIAPSDLKGIRFT